MKKGGKKNIGERLVGENSTVRGHATQIKSG